MVATPTTAPAWSLENGGEDLVRASGSDGKLYDWKPPGTTTTETVRGPATLVYPDGSRLAWDTTITRTDDWRDVQGIGRINFGSVRIGPTVAVYLPPEPIEPKPNALANYFRAWGLMSRLRDIAFGLKPSAKIPKGP